MVTMKQVASLAQVSIATVSRVINDNGYVSPENRTRVFDAMAQLNYQPSALARSLRRKETQTIGLLIPQLDNPFFAVLAFAIEKTLFDQNYRTLICSAQEDRAKEEAYTEMLLRQRVDGAIIVPTGHSADTLRQFTAKEVPVILVDRDLPEVGGTRVLVNNVGGGYAAASHLLQLGHRRIGVVGSPDYSSALRQRLQGVQKALLDAGVAEDDALIVMGTLPHYAMGALAARQMLALSQPPTAIFGMTDVTAVGVMHAAAELGLQLPDDLSIVGYDDIPLAQYTTPQLTTIAQPITEMGARAALFLLEHIRVGEHYTPQTFRLDTELVVRQSTTTARL